MITNNFKQIIKTTNLSDLQNGDIVLYQSTDGDIKLDVSLEDETVWLNQKQIALLFDKAKSTVNEHIKNIFKEKELLKSSSVKKFGNSEFQQKAPYYYNLDVIISVGYRVKSRQGTQFRIWATKRLQEHIVKGFTLNDDRFKSGKSMFYFDELQSRLREIRLSERFFYQKIKDIYKTSKDYDSKNEKTVLFFKIVQNKLIWAISKQTAARLPLLGMKSWDGKNSKKIIKKDVSVSKNYLNEDEIKLLGLLVEQYLTFAETMVQQKKLMYMKDWIAKLDDILQMNDRELLDHAGKISRKKMLEKSVKEYELYKKSQKKLEKVESLKELEADLKQLKTDTNPN